MEPFCISLFRCLPRCHPVYKLLRPHLRTVVAINQGARDDLLPPTSKVAFGLATGLLFPVFVYKQFLDFIRIKLFDFNLINLKYRQLFFRCWLSSSSCLQILSSR